MSNLIPFSSANNVMLRQGDALPAYLADAQTRADLAHLNDDIPSGLNFPVLSIKGKVFTLNKDGESTRLMRPDAPDEVLQSIQLTVVRANPNARVFYADAYVEGAEGDATRPTCYSNDGKSPAADTRDRQCEKCALCPHAVWGTGNEGKGTACTVNTRLAVVAPELLGTDACEPLSLIHI